MEAVFKRRIGKVLLSGFGLVLGLTASGCGRFKAPSTVVHSLYADCNNGEYPKARHLFVQDMQANSDGALEANGRGIKAVCDQMTNSSTLTDVDIKSVKVEGDRAMVVADVHFDTGAARYGDETLLVREDGVWKVDAR